MCIHMYFTVWIISFQCLCEQNHSEEYVDDLELLDCKLF